MQILKAVLVLFFTLLPLTLIAGARDRFLKANDVTQKCLDILEFNKNEPALAYDAMLETAFSLESLIQKGMLNELSTVLAVGSDAHAELAEILLSHSKLPKDQKRAFVQSLVSKIPEHRYTHAKVEQMFALFEQKGYLPDLLRGLFLEKHPNLWNQTQAYRIKNFFLTDKGWATLERALSRAEQDVYLKSSLRDILLASVISKAPAHTEQVLKFVPVLLNTHISYLPFVLEVLHHTKKAPLQEFETALTAIIRTLLPLKGTVLSHELGLLFATIKKHPHMKALLKSTAHYTLKRYSLRHDAQNTWPLYMDSPNSDTQGLVLHLLEWAEWGKFKVKIKLER